MDAMDSPTSPARCGYCGGPSSNAPEYVDEGTRPVDMPATSTAPVMRKLSLCDECSPLRRYAARSSWLHVLDSEAIAGYADAELHTAGAAVFRPLYEVDGYYHRLPPTVPWEHINPTDARMALATLRLGEPAPPALVHPSNRGCSECGVSTSITWGPVIVDGFPLCGQCDSLGAGEPGVMGPWRRLASVFPPGTFTLSATEAFAIDPVLASFRELCRDDRTVDPAGTVERWGVLSADDREALTRWVASTFPYVCPESWRRRWGRTAAPVASGPVKRTAVLL